MLWLSAIPELSFGMMGTATCRAVRSCCRTCWRHSRRQKRAARRGGASDHPANGGTCRTALLLLERGERHLADERRVVYDAAHGRELPGALLRREGGPACADPRANAFWDGTEMVYGDGDGVVLGDFTRALDVIAHELTHGLTRVLR